MSSPTAFDGSLLLPLALLWFCILEPCVVFRAHHFAELTLHVPGLNPLARGIAAWWPCRSGGSPTHSSSLPSTHNVSLLIQDVYPDVSTS